MYNKEDCTKNPESKFSHSMKRVIQTFNLKDSFRALHPSDRIFSRYYVRQGQEGASRIDRSSHWGAVTPVSAWYESVAFSDHLAYIVRLSLPGNMDKLVSPKSRSFFKTKPEVIKDNIFQQQLRESMIKWRVIRSRGLEILPWWELIVKPGIKKLAITRGKEIRKQTRRVLNMLLIKQTYFTDKLQAGNQDILGQLRETQDRINEWYEEESNKIVIQSRIDDFQESEKVRIYHHEQHRKLIKRSSILKLKPKDSENQVANLLLKKAVLNP